MPKSPRKSPKKRLRKPQRCSKCADHPLRSECIHTSTGQKFLASKAQKEAETLHTPPRRSTRPQANSGVNSLSKTTHARSMDAAALTHELSSGGRKCQICPGRPIRMECKHTSKGREYLASEGAKKIVDDVLNPSLPDIASDVFYDGESTVARSSPLAYAEVSQLSHTSPFDDDGGNATVFSSPFSLSVSTQGTSPVEYTNKRVKATGSNPLYGHIAGVKRGNQPYKIYRTKPLPQVIENSGKASQRFSRLANKIVERCEAISRETGAWLFFAAQHTSARGGALSYASPRICREAQVEVSELATNFNATVSALLRSRRTDALALQKRLDKAIADRERAEEDARRGEEKLAVYRAQYGELNASEN